jgi:hypothetical protein
MLFLPPFLSALFRESIGHNPAVIPGCAEGAGPESIERQALAKRGIPGWMPRIAPE